MEPKNVQLKNFINLRMGGFHASCIFITVIVKRFGAAGLKDLCFEATHWNKFSLKHDKRERQEITRL